MLTTPVTTGDSFGGSFCPWAGCAQTSTTEVTRIARASVLLGKVWFSDASRVARSNGSTSGSLPGRNERMGERGPLLIVLPWDEVPAWASQRARRGFIRGARHAGARTPAGGGGCGLARGMATRAGRQAVWRRCRAVLLLRRRRSHGARRCAPSRRVLQCQPILAGATDDHTFNPPDNRIRCCHTVPYMAVRKRFQPATVVRCNRYVNHINVLFPCDIYIGAIAAAGANKGIVIL